MLVRESTHNVIIGPMNEYSFVRGVAAGRVCNDDLGGVDFDYHAMPEI